MAKKEKQEKQKKPRYMLEHDGQKIGVDGVLAAFPCGRDLLVIRVTEFKKKKALDIRRLWLNNDEEWTPGKGAFIPVEYAKPFVEKMSDPKFAKELVTLLGE